MARPTYLFKLTLLFGLCLSANACVIAKYELDEPIITVQRPDALVPYDPPLRLVIPQYYISTRCSKYTEALCPVWGATRMGGGVMAVFTQAEARGQRFPVELSEAIPSKGVACVISLLRTSEDQAIRETLSQITFTVLPMYLTREYVLSYQFTRNLNEVKLYQYKIREQVISSVFAFILAPAILFRDDVWMGAYPLGPTGVASFISPLPFAIRKATTHFVTGVQQEGILVPVPTRTSASRD